MSDIAPPRPAERALEALGADPDFCDAVIGDLAEEFAIRAAWDGPVVARRWYYRESLRVAPHLLRNWWGSLRRRDIGYFANVTALSSVLMLMLEGCMLLAVMSLDLAVGALNGSPHGYILRGPFFGPVALAAVILVWSLGAGIFGGYIAAWLGSRAPLPSALSLAAVWAAATIGSNVLTRESATRVDVPLWFRALNITILVSGMVAGGVLRVGRASATPRATGG